MEKDENEKTFNHDKASVSDKISLIGELCHIRHHALRAVVSTWEEEKESDDSDFVRYLILAKRAQEMRREYMRKHFKEIKDSDWCLCKAAACLHQLAYEVCEGDAEELKEIDDLVDDIWGAALNMDLSECRSCIDDKKA